jgi:hypothetical protein
METDGRDKCRIYCPALGMVCEFSYCKDAGPTLEPDAPDAPLRRLPCPRMVGCWARRMDVAAFLVENYTEDEIARVLGPRTPRVDHLYLAAERAAGKAPEE